MDASFKATSYGSERTRLGLVNHSGMKVVVSLMLGAKRNSSEECLLFGRKGVELLPHRMGFDAIPLGAREEIRG